jgi:predicted kinase
MANLIVLAGFSNSGKSTSLKYLEGGYLEILEMR